MTSPGSMARVRVDASCTFQTIDGFGVNVNAKYWNDGKLISPPYSLFTLTTLQ